MKFGGLEPRRYEDIKEIVAPEIDPKSFGTFEKQAPDRVLFRPKGFTPYPLLPSVNKSADYTSKYHYYF